MKPFFLHSFLLVAFGFFIQNVWSKTIRGICDIRRYIYEYTYNWPNIKVNTPNSNERLMNLTFDFDSVFRKLYMLQMVEESLKRTFGKDYKVERYMKIMESTILVAWETGRWTKKGWPGVNIYYEDCHFHPVYNLDTSKYDFNQTLRSFRSYDQSYSGFLSIPENLNSIQIKPKYDENGVLVSLKIVYEDSLTIQCLHFDEKQITAHIILNGSQNTKEPQRFCEGHYCLTPRTYNGTKNLVSMLRDGKISNFSLPDSNRNWSEVQGDYSLFFDGNSTCRPGRENKNSWIVFDENKNEVILYYASDNYHERALIILHKNRTMQTSLTISDLEQNHLAERTLVFIEGDQQEAFTTAEKLGDGEKFVINEMSTLKLIYSYAQKIITGARGIALEKCRRFEHVYSHRFFSQHILICEVIKGNKRYFIYKVI